MKIQYKKKEFGNSIFVQVFYHSVVVDRGSKTWFKDNEISFSNRRYKYSILGMINEVHKINGMYEFIIEYPDGYTIHWSQETTPLTNISEVNFLPIDVKCSRFEGLALSTEKKSTFIDGVRDGLWYYSIGSKAAYKESIPGWLKDGTSGNYIETNYKEVTLWLRIESIDDIINKFPIFSLCSRGNNCVRIFRAETILLLLFIGC